VKTEINSMVLDQANIAVESIFSKRYKNLHIVLEGEKFVEGEKGVDKFELDGLLVSPDVILIVEARKSLREEHVEKIVSTAENAVKYWEKVRLRANGFQLPSVHEREVIRVLVAPVAPSEVISAVDKRTEKFCVIVDSGNAFDIVHDSSSSGFTKLPATSN
jgi:hypothetical protein